MMGKRRLFLAINLEEAVKNQINEIITYLRLFIKQGRLVDFENLHLTLEFLGETDEDQLKEIIKILDTLDYEKFILHPTALDYFNTRKGRLYWLGMEKNDTLQELQSELHQKLLEQNFELESRQFLPHITIGRKIKVKQKLNLYEIEKRLKQIEIKVEKVDLMESRLVEDKPTYSTIYSRKLE